MELDEGIDNFSPIRSTIGVLGLVRFGARPAIMPQQAINAIRQQEQRASDQCKNQPNWKSGDRVEIINGPFVGFNGIFEKENDEERVIILLEMLGRKNNVAVSLISIAPTYS